MKTGDLDRTLSEIRSFQEVTRVLSGELKHLHDAVRGLSSASLSVSCQGSRYSNILSSSISQITAHEEGLRERLRTVSGAGQVLAAQEKTLKAVMKASSTWSGPSGSLERIGGAALALASSTSDFLSLSRAMGAREADMARLMEPVAYQTKFLSSAMKRIAQSDNPMLTDAYGVALDVSSRSLLLAGASLVQFAEANVPYDGSSPARPYNIGRAVVRDQTRLPDVAERNEADPLPQSNDINVKVHVVLGLVTACNETALLAGGAEVFTPTTKIMSAFADAPIIIATDRARFADFVDCLFFILYEGAGRDKLRYLKEHGGALDRDECEAVWAVKHLRNKLCRHDVDHGDISRVRKSWAGLRDTLQRLGVSGVPHRRCEFMQIQWELICQIERMLSTMLERMKSAGATQ